MSRKSAAFSAETNGSGNHFSPLASAENHLAALAVALLGFFPFDSHLRGEGCERHGGYGTGLADLSDSNVLSRIELKGAILLKVAREYRGRGVHFVGGHDERFRYGLFLSVSKHLQRRLRTQERVEKAAKG